MDDDDIILMQKQIMDIWEKLESYLNKKQTNKDKVFNIIKKASNAGIHSSVLLQRLSSLQKNELDLIIQQLSQERLIHIDGKKIYDGDIFNAPR